VKVSAIQGVQLLRHPANFDNRGSWTRMFDQELIQAPFEVAQASSSGNLLKGTTRGLHYLDPAYGEAKIVGCLEGEVFDVVVDMRVDSPTYLAHMTVRLGFKSEFMSLVIPPGCAHGFQTTQDKSTLIYFMSKRYEPTLELGVRYDEPQLGIDWPQTPTVISPKDLSWKAL
jgi:dTDP-4-dehydrorhamnose 3,5-epimerase